MKKITMFMAAAALMLSACGSKDAKEDGSKVTIQQLSSDPIKTNVDSLLYYVGVSQSQGFNEYAMGEQGLNLDSALVDELIQGIIDGANLDNSDKKKAYYEGVGIGRNMASSLPKNIAYQLYGSDEKADEINMKSFLKGFIAAVKGTEKIDPQEAGAKVDGMMSTIKESSMSGYKQQNEEYIKKIAKADGVKVLPEDSLCTGIYYKVLAEGNGAVPASTDRVKVNYEGKTIDGNVFDSSYERGEPVEFGCNQVIRGWLKALTHMTVGSKWEVYIPAEAAYGDQNMGGIKPYSTLVFTIELLDIVK